MNITIEHTRAKLHQHTDVTHRVVEQILGAHICTISGLTDIHTPSVIVIEGRTYIHTDYIAAHPDAIAKIEHQLSIIQAENNPTPVA